MLVGAQPAVSVSSRSQRIDEPSAVFGGATQPNSFCYGEGLLLSKNSLQLQLQHDQVSLELSSRDIYDFISTSDSRLKSQASLAYTSAWPGEPATPNGNGDVFSAQSPVCASRIPAGCGYATYGHGQPLDPLAEDAPSCFTTPRRRYSCSHGLGVSSASPEAGRLSGPAAPRHGRFLSFSNPAQTPLELISAWPSSTSASISAVATPVVADRPAFPVSGVSVGQLTAADTRARSLELHLRDQRAANEALVRQLRAKDEELEALRAELRRMAAAQGQQQQWQEQRPAEWRSTPGEEPAVGYGVAAVPAPRAAPAGLLTQLQRARDKLCAQEQQREAAMCRDVSGSGELPSPPCTPPPASLHAVCEDLLSAGAEEQVAAEPQRFCGATARGWQPKQIPMPPAGRVQALASVASPGKDTGTSPPHAAAARATVTVAEACIHAGADAAGLAAERRRTDRAHAALLASSRQAAALSAQVAALRARASELQQELADWRSACLDNHKQLARLKRAAAAQHRAKEQLAAA